MDGKLVSPSAREEETLIQKGLLAATLVSTDHITLTAVPTYMDKYTESQIRMNDAFCQAYSRRFIRYQAVLKPAMHAVAWIDTGSPLMELISAEVHKKLSCGLCPQSYRNGIHIAGFCSTGLQSAVCSTL